MSVFIALKEKDRVYIGVDYNPYDDEKRSIQDLHKLVFPSGVINIIVAPLQIYSEWLRISEQMFASFEGELTKKFIQQDVVSKLMQMLEEKELSLGEKETIQMFFAYKDKLFFLSNDMGVVQVADYYALISDDILKNNEYFIKAVMPFFYIYDKEKVYDKFNKIYQDLYHYYYNIDKFNLVIDTCSLKWQKIEEVL